MKMSLCIYCGVRCYGIACPAHRDLLKEDPLHRPELRKPRPK